MKSNKLLSNSKTATCFLILIYTIFSSTQIMAADFYATPMGGGNMNGSDWENAIPGEKIENIINTVMNGGDRLFLDDKGSFFNNLQITISRGGSDISLPIIIEGVETDDGYPLFKGTDRSTGVFIYLNASVSYISFKNIKIEDYKYAIETEEANSEPNEYIVLDGLDINNVTDGLYLRDFRNSIIKNCEVTYHTKRGVRLRTGCRNLEIVDCYTDHNMGDYGNFPSNQFPVGFEVGEGRDGADSLDQTNITFIRCEARNCVDDDQSYWNGDGFLVNDKHYDVRFYNCISYGNADGGWDDKGIGTYYENCIAVGNGRNFRNWHSGTYVNCLAVNPSKYAEGASGGNDNWWFDGQWGDAIVDLYNCTSHNGSFSSSEHKVQVREVENCIFSNSIDESWVATGVNNIYTDNPDEPNYLAPSLDYNGHPLDAYNSQYYGPERGYWYVEGKKPLFTNLSATPENGDTPLDVLFNVSASDPDGVNTSISYRWFLNDIEISDKKEFTHTFNIPGEYSVIVEARDEDFLSVFDTIFLTVTGNYPPEIGFEEPSNQQVFFSGQTINIKVNASDRDGSIDSVGFYLNNNYIGTDSTEPYEFSIPGLPVGMYTLMARAYDNNMIFIDDSVTIESIIPITLYGLSWEGYVDLYWEDHLYAASNEFGDLSGYNIYRSTVTGSDYVKVNNSIIDTAGFKDTSIENGTLYYYVVTAENTLGNDSSFSNQVIATPQLSLKLDCLDDAHVRDGSYGNDNYGSEPELVVKNATEDWQRFSYLKFDLSSLGSLAKATLRLKSTDLAPKFHMLKCYLATNDSWTEESITWNTKPDTSSLIDITKVPGTQSWFEFDITTKVETEIAGDGILSLVILKVEEGNPGFNFHSKESGEESDHPMLFITPIDITSYNISASAGDGGSIKPEGEINVFTGYNQSFIIIPENGYFIDDVLVDNVSQGSINEYTFTNILSDHSIEVVFTPQTGLNEMNADNEFSLYPNPARDKIIISSAHDDFDVEVYSIRGTLIKSFRNITNQKIISTTQFRKEDLYIIKISTDEVVEIKKLIIQE